MTLASHDSEKEGSDKNKKCFFHILRVLNKMYAEVFTTSDLTIVLNCRHFILSTYIETITFLLVLPNHLFLGCTVMTQFFGQGAGLTGTFLENNGKTLDSKESIIF